MAIYHLHTHPLSRAKGHSAVAATAYRSGLKLRDWRTGTTHDYRKKHGILWSGIIDANGQTVPNELREALWNAAEASEHRKDSRMAREIECALPTEFRPQQYSRLIRNFVHAVQAGEFAGSACDYAIHNKGDGNPHVHMLFTIRTTQIDAPTKSITMGERILFEMREADRKAAGLPGTRDKMQWLRKIWADLVNEEFAARGSHERIDHRTLAAQGIRRQPQMHQGRARTHGKKWQFPQRPETTHAQTIPHPYTKPEQAPPTPSKHNPPASPRSQKPDQRPVLQLDPMPPIKKKAKPKPEKQRPTADDYIRSAIDYHAKKRPRRARLIHQFIEYMKAQGIETILNRARNGRVSGISFQYQGERMKGSDIGWSLAKLQRAGIILPLHYAEEKAALCRYREEVLEQIQIAREQRKSAEQETTGLEMRL